MSDFTSFDDTMPLVSEPARGATRHAAGQVAVRVFKRAEQVSEAWQRLEAQGVASPGQSRAVLRHWIAAVGVPVAEQFFVVAEMGGEPIALLPLTRKRVRGLRVLGWFTGKQFGTAAPLVDRSRLIEMGPQGRRGLWAKLATSLAGEADLVHLTAVPTSQEAGVDLFGELGLAVTSGLDSRATFASWAEVASTQWTKTRRARDRERGDRLAAAGTVGYQEIAGSHRRAATLMEVLLAQKSAAAEAADPWTTPEGIDFLRSATAPGSGLDVRLQVLSLDKQLAAIRMNLVFGDRMFAVTSSVINNPAIQELAPVEQCLLRAMHAVFDNGIGSVDFGLGASLDERRWCNQFVPVVDRYLPLSGLGRTVAWGTIGWRTVERIATSPAVRQMRGWMVSVLSGRGKSQAGAGDRWRSNCRSRTTPSAPTPEP